MTMKMALIGSLTAIVGFGTYKYMARPNPSIFTEKSFFEEALTLARGYKPIKDKLGEPIKPLTIDTSNAFNELTLLSAQVQIPIRGAQRSGTVYCYATRHSLDDPWYVDRLEFKANNQPNKFLFYDRAYRRVPTPSEQELIDYKTELAARIASSLPPKEST